MPALRPYVADPEGFAETDRAAAEVLCLPIFPEMTDEEVQRVIAAVRSFGRGAS
jgi:dTDP-4-amino-4,6-dideoxygalactose transaminase